MKLALIEAKKADNRNEVPVGAIITDENNNIIASNGNRMRELNDPRFFLSQYVFGILMTVLTLQ